MKNNVKAMMYVVTGGIVSLAAINGFVAMLLSGSFLPVYVGSTYVVGNKILRYMLYAALVVVIILSAKLAAYGMKYLNKKFRKIRRR